MNPSDKGLAKYRQPHPRRAGTRVSYIEALDYNYSLPHILWIVTGFYYFVFYPVF